MKDRSFRRKKGNSSKIDLKRRKAAFSRGNTSLNKHVEEILLGAF